MSVLSWMARRRQGARLVPVTVTMYRDGGCAEEEFLLPAVPRKGDTVFLGTRVAMVVEVRHHLAAGAITVIAE